MAIPEPTKTPNFSPLEAACQEYLDALEAGPESHAYHKREDFAHNVFEKAMEALYGPNIWDYINERSRTFDFSSQGLMSALTSLRLTRVSCSTEETPVEGREALMASEILSVPEEHLAEVIAIIRKGIEESPEVSDDVKERLTEWCDDEEEYLEGQSDLEGEGDEDDL